MTAEQIKDQKADPTRFPPELGQADPDRQKLQDFAEGILDALNEGETTDYVWKTFITPWIKENYK